MRAAPTKRKAKHVNLTKVSIEAIKPPAEGRTYTYDTKVSGLAICTTAAGTKTFYLYRKVDGKPERYPLGRWPLFTVEQARGQAEKIIGKHADGINPNDHRREARQASTLREAFTDYLAMPTRTKSKRPRAPKTVHDYKLLFDAYLAHWENRKLSQIHRADVEALHNELAENNGQYTANHALVLLRAVYNATIEAGYSGGNPTAGVRKFEEQSRERFLHADELPRFWAALEDEKSEKVRDFVKVALFTGQRRGNVLAMKWADVNLERAVWSIPKVKGGKPHQVPLSGVVLEIVRRRHEHNGESDYVFPGLHGHGHLKDPMRAWRDVLQRAGIDDLRIHDLRRSLGSWQTATGSSLSIVGKTLGHTRPETTAIYSRLELQPVRDSVETATAAIMAATKPKKAAKQRKGRGNG